MDFHRRRGFPLNSWVSFKHKALDPELARSWRRSSHYGIVFHPFDQGLWPSGKLVHLGITFQGFMPWIFIQWLFFWAPPETHQDVLKINSETFVHSLSSNRIFAEGERIAFEACLKGIKSHDLLVLYRGLFFRKANMHSTRVQWEESEILAWYERHERRKRMALNFHVLYLKTRLWMKSLKTPSALHELALKLKRSERFHGNSRRKIDSFCPELEGGISSAQESSRHRNKITTSSRHPEQRRSPLFDMSDHILAWRTFTFERSYSFQVFYSTLVFLIAYLCKNVLWMNTNTRSSFLREYRYGDQIQIRRAFLRPGIDAHAPRVPWADPIGFHSVPSPQFAELITSRDRRAVTVLGTEPN